jgi:hypothetical protein
MKLYKNMEVELAYQNVGGKWVGLLMGAHEEIELAFNSLFNHGATNGALQYLNAEQTSGYFWTTATKMIRYFERKYEFLPETNQIYETDPVRCKQESKVYSIACMAQLSASQTVVENLFPEFDGEPMEMGTISAEKPDEDFKDKVLFHSLGDKGAPTALPTNANNLWEIS